MKLFAVILTYNESENITACIESVRFADHIIVYDSFSRDDTPVLAIEAGAEVAQRGFDDYASQRNAALSTAGEKGADWVLFVDADERIPPKLEDEILLALDRTDANYAGWRIPRHNYIFGKLTRGAGWYPDYQTRLLRVDKARYDPTHPVHEVVLLDGDLGTLQQPLIHHNYRDLEHFTAKQTRYAKYDAQILHEQGIQPRPHKFITQPLRQFWWRFVTLKGYRDGLHGLRLSLLMARYERQKYVLLRELVGRERPT
jgi:hypothetical protein